MRNFKLMILAAGYGKRMKNLTKNVPKPLLRIKNTTLLTNAIYFFKNLGCDKFIINSHYMHDMIANYINLNHSKENINLLYEPEILDTGGAIKNAKEYFESENILITNSDIYWTKNNIQDVKNFIDKIHQCESYYLLLSSKKNTIGIDRLNGDFVIENNYVKRWEEGKPTFFYSGLQILNPKIFYNIKDIKFSVNMIWDELILQKKLKAKVLKTKLIHVGDIKTFNKIIS